MESEEKEVVEETKLTPEQEEAADKSATSEGQNLQRSDKENTEVLGLEDPENPAPSGSGPDSCFTLEDSPYLHPGNPFRRVKCRGKSGGPGVTLVDGLKFCEALLRKMQDAKPCMENQVSMDAIKGAIGHQNERARKRVAQGVKGTGKKHVS